MKKERNNTLREDNENIKREIKKILLTPIEVLGKRKLKTITYSENMKKILSPQDYKRSWDPDMSRLSVLFYEKIYKKEMLEYGLPIDKDFLGDTMFKSNYFLVYDLKRKHPEDEKKIDKKAKDLDTMYHCLANFWSIPMIDGRTLRKVEGENGLLMKLNRYDSPDLYLKKAPEQNNIFHYFQASDKRIKLIENLDISILSEYEKAIKQRADDLVEKRTSDLYTLFKDQGLMKL